MSRKALKAKCSKLAIMLSRASTSRQLALLLEDLLTPAEIDDLVQRFEIIKALLKGQDQRSISKELGVSIAKVTRGSHALKRKGHGFRRLLKKS